MAACATFNPPSCLCTMAELLITSSQAIFPQDLGLTQCSRIRGAPLVSTQLLFHLLGAVGGVAPSLVYCVPATLCSADGISNLLMAVPTERTIRVTERFTNIKECIFTLPL